MTLKKCYLKDKYGISQKISGKIGVVNAKTKKEALKKAHRLTMYDYGQKTTAWKYWEYKEKC
ncbi:MAG: hypothetical protein Q7R52_03060 [archaeon]|nr:hypothetical protein [archaeon]